ncbi:MAG: GNAT family N-acetyltransferase, partial [Cyanobacteria bacterium P01_H01_bin.58]
SPLLFTSWTGRQLQARNFAGVEAVMYQNVLFSIASRSLHRSFSAATYSVICRQQGGYVRWRDNLPQTKNKETAPVVWRVLMPIRVAQATDIPELATLFHQTVRTHGPQHYSPEQTCAWAAAGADTPTFRQFILSVTTFVMEDASGIAGFVGISEEGYVASIYVRCDRLRQGIGSALMNQVMDYAQTHKIPRLYAEASEFSLGLFQKFGFWVYDTEVVERAGVQFKRYLVERTADKRSENNLANDKPSLSS